MPVVKAQKGITVCKHHGVALYSLSFFIILACSMIEPVIVM